MRLHADPEVNVEGRAVIGGYGWLNHAKGKPPVVGLNLSKTVSVDLPKAAEARRETSERAQDEWLELELARIDKVQSAIWQQCLSGNLGPSTGSSPCRPGGRRCSGRHRAA